MQANNNDHNNAGRHQSSSNTSKGSTSSGLNTSNQTGYDSNQLQLLVTVSHSHQKSSVADVNEHLDAFSCKLVIMAAAPCIISSTEVRVFISAGRPIKVSPQYFHGGSESSVVFKERSVSFLTTLALTVAS